MLRNLSTLLKKTSKGKYDIGECKSITIKCLSELGWFDNKLYELEGKTQKAENHWMLVRNQKNLAGVTSLISVESLSGRNTTFLQDCGWRHSFIDEIYKNNKIDQMLKKKEIDFLFITHEHHDHFLGVPCVLRHFPEIPIYIPHTFTENAYKYLKQEKMVTTAEPNTYQKHEGELHKIKEGEMIQLGTGGGMAATMFSMDLGGGLNGESTIFTNIAGKGIVILTGCCHKGIHEVIKFSKDNILGGDNVYGIYGGLHLGPYGYMMKNSKESIEKLAKLGIPKVAANHCTGGESIDEMYKAGVNVVKGKEKNHITDGDIITF